MSINLRSHTMRPVRAACLGTATALVTLLACAPVAAAATDTALVHAKGGDRVITLFGQLAKQTRFPINPGGDPAQGDRTAFRSVLYYDEAETHVAGETNGTCTTTWVPEVNHQPDVDHQAEVCVVTYTLPGGQLAVQGMIFGNLTATPPLRSTTRSPAAPGYSTGLVAWSTPKRSVRARGASRSTSTTDCPCPSPVRRLGRPLARPTGSIGPAGDAATTRSQAIHYQRQAAQA
ncbi:hypothetical protein [Streptomyces aureus]|uniref:hypothetical protein n=1 Tax=Streptomyces aureus TaxID=193461 RepID=UPI0036437009